MNRENRQRRFRPQVDRWVAMCGVLLTAATSSRALLVTFDTTGYSAVGTTNTVLGVNGKPINTQGDGSKWADAGVNFAVVAAAGKGGDNNGLVSAASQLANASATLTPTLAELGVASFSTNAIQRVSMDVRLIDNGAVSTELYRLGCALSSSAIYPLEFQVLGNGNVAVRSDGLTKLTLTNALPKGGTYRTFVGAINYKTRSVDVSLDGSPQGTYAFTNAYTAYGFFKFNVRRTSTTVGVTIDNVSAQVSVIPIIPRTTLVLLR